MAQRLTFLPSTRSPLARSLSALLLSSVMGILASAPTALAGPSLQNMGSHPQGRAGRAQQEWRLVEPDPSNPEGSELTSTDRSVREQTPLQCPVSARNYRKALLITAFPRREQVSSNLGGLHGAELQLPQLLGEKLSESGSVWHQRQLSRSLPSSPSEPARLAQQVRQLAHNADAQLVLTGEVLDMSLTNVRDVQAPGLVTRSRNSLVNRFNLSPDWDTRQRDFVLQLELKDGVTGEPVFRQQYRTRGVWNPKRGREAGFGSPQFWDTHYGEQIEALLRTASAEVGEAIRCQPLASRLETARPGQPLVLSAGSGQGLQPGDRLPLYRLAQRPIAGAYRQYQAQLIDTGERVRVIESHRQHSVVQVEGEQPLSGSYLALTPQTGLQSLSQSSAGQSR